MTFIKLYRTLGVRLIKDLLVPKVIKTDSFSFPRGSALFYLGDFNNHNFPRSGVSYLSNQSKTYLYTVEEYFNPIGGFRKSSVKPSSLIRENKSIDDGHRYVSTKAKMFLSAPATMTIFNYGVLHELYKYKHNRDMDYDTVFNTLKTLLHDAGGDPLTERVRYIPISIPATLPKAKEFFTGLKRSKAKVSEIFNTPELKVIFELFKWLNSDTSKESVFSELNSEEMDSTVFIFTYGNSMAMVSAKNLKGIVKGSGLDTKMPEYSGKKPGYILLHFLLNIVRSEPQTVETLEKKETKYDKIAEMKDEAAIESMLENLETSVDSELEEKAEDEIEISGDTTIIDSMDTLDIEVPTLEDVLTVNKSSYDITMEALKNKLAIGDINEKEYDRQIAILSEQEEKGVLKNAEIKPEDLLIDEASTLIEDIEMVSDKSMLKDTIGAIDKKYIEQVMEKDIVNVVYAMQNTGHVIEDYKVEKSEDILGKVEEHQITIQPTHGRKTTLKLRVPGIDESGVFKISGNSYVLRKQRTDVPIKKTNATTVGLTSYYGKLFITKASFKKSDTGYAIRNSLIKLSSEENPTIKLLVLGENSIFDEKLPLVYSMFGRYVKSFVHKGIRYNFDFKNRETFLNSNDKLSDIEKGKYTLIGVNKTKYIVMDIDNNVYDVEKGKYTPISDLFTILEIDYENLPVEFSSIKIMNEQLPTVLLLMYYYGITKLIKMLKAKVRIVPSNKREEISSNEYVIKFKDKKYIFDRTDKLASMILGGLVELKKELVTLDAKSLDTKDGVINICLQRELKNRHVTEIKILESMYVDPITKSVLETLKEPTTFIGLLIRANELLLTDDANHPNSLDGMLIKGYERISGMIYKELVTAVRDYENKNGVVQTRLTVNPFSVWAAINTDSTSSLVDDLNPVMSLKQKEEVTYTGSGGRSKDTLTKPTREYHESEIGIVSEATKDSSDVGVNAYLSAAPLLNNVRGISTDNDMKDIEAANILSTSALLAPGAINDDPKRIGFVSIQNSHTIPLSNQSILPVRTGYDVVIGERLDDKYVATAEEDGKVKQLTKTKLVVTYKSGKEKTINLKEWLTKEEAGVCYKHKIITPLTITSKFKRGDVLSYDDMFFAPDLFDKKKVAMKTGVLIRTMLIESQDTHEDSFSISESTTKKLNSKITKVKSIKLDKEMDLLDIVKVGDKVDYDTKLLTMVHKGAEDDTDIGYELSDTTIDLLSEIKNKSPLAKIRGTIERIVVYYNCEFEDMTKSLQQVAKTSDLELSSREGRKITGRVNSTYSINGKPLIDGFLEVKIYIQTSNDMGLADKAVLANQLKCTVGHIFSDKTRTEDGNKVEGKFSRRAISARIVNSPDTIGTTSTLLKELSKKAAAMFFDE